MKVGIASDEIGSDLRQAIKAHLVERDGVSCIDLTPDRGTVYGPEVAERVGLAIVNRDLDRGILVCGSGVGMAIAANKVAGVRAVLCQDAGTAAHARQSSDTQMLVLGCRFLDPVLALAIVDTWLAADYEPNPRREQRLRDLASLEGRFGRTPTARGAGRRR